MSASVRGNSTIVGTVLFEHQSQRRSMFSLKASSKVRMSRKEMKAVCSCRSSDVIAS
jgi:hypothetical protein